MIIAIDTETYDKKGDYYEPTLNTNKFTIGCLIREDRKQPIYFYKSKDMRNYLLELCANLKKRKQKAKIYAHKMIYDYLAIMKPLLFDKRNLIVRDGQPFIMIYDKTLYFLDTLNFYKATLDQIAEKHNMKKLEMPKKIREPTELKKYVIQDTQIVYNIITGLKKDLKILGFEPKKLHTAGQVSISTYWTWAKKNKVLDKITMRTKDKIPTMVKSPYENEIRKTHRGGRTDAFQIGTYQNCTMIDINSLYPYIMTKMQYPNLNTENYSTNLSEQEITQKIATKLGIISCEITINGNLSPLMIRYAGYSISPTNIQLRGIWTITEIKEALLNGAQLDKVNYIITYDKLHFNPFKRYIETMYKKRKESTGTLPYAIKLIMNNLASKFSQKSKGKEYELCKPDKIYTKKSEGWEITSKIDQNFIISKEIQSKRPNFIAPYLTSEITALARIELFKWLKKIPNQDRLYCDTDSIAFKGDHLDKFPISNEIGEFKVLHKNQPMTIYGEKKYQIGKQVKHSGISTHHLKEGLYDKKTVDQYRIQGIKKGLQKGDMAVIGTFHQQTTQIQVKAKKNLILPRVINEHHKT